MPTKISYQTWSGGSGSGDQQILIGYCKEEPIEVLIKVYKEFYIYSYKGLYRPIDYSYPNNCLGLVIDYVKDDAISGMTITGDINDLNLNCAFGKSLERTEETFKEGIELSRNWHIFKGMKEDKKLEIENILKEIESAVFGK